MKRTLEVLYDRAIQRLDESEKYMNLVDEKPCDCNYEEAKEELLELKFKCAKQGERDVEEEPLPSHVINRIIMDSDSLLKLEEKQVMFCSMLYSMYTNQITLVVYKPDVILENILYIIDKVREEGFICSDVIKNSSGYNSITITNACPFGVNDEQDELFIILKEIYQQRIFHLRRYKDCKEIIEMDVLFESTKVFLNMLGYKIEYISDYKALITIPIN